MYHLLCGQTTRAPLVFIRSALLNMLVTIIPLWLPALDTLLMRRGIPGPTMYAEPAYVAERSPRE